VEKPPQKHRKGSKSKNTRTLARPERQAKANACVVIEIQSDAEAGFGA